MGSSLVPPASGSASIPSDNWILMSSVVPTAGATTVTFSSIALRKKLMLRINNPTLSGSTTTITFNGDTGANYSIYGLGANSTSGAVLAPYNATDATGFVLGGSVTQIGGVLTIEESDTTNIKNIWGYLRVSNPGGTNAYPDILASYKASAAITSITITTAGTFNAVGTIALYGVSA